jgi:hypothetical protein
VGLGGERANDEATRDLGVAKASGDDAEDLALALGQVGERGGRSGCVPAGRELGDQSAG